MQCFIKIMSTILEKYGRVNEETFMQVKWLFKTVTSNILPWPWPLNNDLQTSMKHQRPIGGVQSSTWKYIGENDFTMLYFVTPAKHAYNEVPRMGEFASLSVKFTTCTN